MRMSQQLSASTPFTAQTYRAALKWAAVELGIHLVLVAVGLAWAEGKPEWFVHFGREYPALPLAKQVLGPDLLVPHDDGHDGQSFWVVARNPLLLQGETTLAPYLDRPVLDLALNALRAIAPIFPLLALDIVRQDGGHAPSRG